MDYLELAPPPPLDRLVHRFWFLRGTPDAAGGGQTIVPDGRTEIVLHLGEPFAQADGPRPARAQAPMLMAGQLTGPLYLVPRAGADVVGIRLRTGAERALLRMPMHELTGLVVPLADIAAGLGPPLLDAAASAHGRRARAGALAHALAHLVVQQPRQVVRAAVTRLESAPASSIQALARDLGLTPRTLQRWFLEEVGISPRLLGRILRFRAAFGLLDRLPAGRWTAAAHASGYFDQAHLIRDFRRFAGAAPSAFFRRGPDLARAFAGAEEMAQA